jgi:hypothetical protein
MISPGLFRTFERRDVDWADLYNEQNVAPVSESFAHETWNTVAGALLGSASSWGQRAPGKK